MNSVPQHQAAELLAALAVSGVVLLGVGVAGAALLARGRDREQCWTWMALTVALAGYAAFWCGFLSPGAGRLFSWAVAGAAAVVNWRRFPSSRDCLKPQRGLLLVTLLIGAGYGALVELYPLSSTSETAQGRFMEGMPGDNGIPRVFTEIIENGNPTRVLDGDWLTSDRPPLQTGVSLLVLPELRALGFGLDTACTAVGIWCQLLWVPVLHLLLRAFGLSARRALAAVAVAAFTGFLLLNSVFVWPKLASAAFAVMAFSAWFLPGEIREGEPPRRRFLFAGACAGCASLYHGAALIALLALVPFILARWRRWRLWLLSALAFLALAIPWLAYQLGYSPPGNRLEKWHIAGVVPVDSRSFFQALRDHYSEVGWQGAIEARRRNCRMLIAGSWTDLIVPLAGSGIAARRSDDVAFPLRAASSWWLGLALLPIAAIRMRRCRQGAGASARAHCLGVAWLAGTLIVWVGVMFRPDQVFSHQGTYVVQLLLFGLLISWAMIAHPGAFGVVAALQVAEFARVWIAARPGVGAAADPLAFTVMTAAAVVLLAVAARQLWDSRNEPALAESGG